MPRVRRTPPAPRRRKPRPGGGGILSLTALLFLLALGTVVRVNALPVEARTQETWYSYTHQLKFDYTAYVEKGLVYPSAVVRADDLIRQRLPVDPPAYRRVVVPKLLQGLTVSLPYHFKADRPGEIQVTYRVDGTLSAPGFWQRPYLLLSERMVWVSGAEVTLTNDLELEIPVRRIIAEMEELSQKQRLNYERLELKVRPVIEVTVDGQREPVEARLQPEFVLAFRDRESALEIDEPRVVQDSKAMSVTRVVPLTVNLFGREVKVATVRLVAVAALGGLLLVLVGVWLTRFLRRRTRAVEDLGQLGGSLIDSEQVEYPGDLIVIEVRTVRQMLTLHLQTHRPVIRTGNVYHLIDGNTCYRLVVREEA